MTEHLRRRNSGNFYDAFNITDECDPQFLTQTKGVRFVSELKRLENFGIPEGFGVDPFHDLEEGILKDILRATLGAFVKNGAITETSIESRICGFNYETDLEHQINDMRHWSGLQTKNLAFRFNFMFSDLRNKVNIKYFEAISLIVEIVKIVYSSELNEDHLQKLRNKLESFKRIWIDVYKKNGKPKLHNLIVHYVDMIRIHGPLSILETTSYERNHRQLTRTMEKGPQYMNVTKMCAEKYMFWWSQKWNSCCDGFYELKKHKETISTINMHNVVYFPSSVNWNTSHTIVTAATMIHTYKPDLYVVHGTFNNFVFFKIKTIIIVNGEIYLKCSHLKTSYSTFYTAFKILSEENQFSIFSLEDLFTKEPFCHAKPIDSNSKYIISLRS